MRSSWCGNVATSWAGWVDDGARRRDSFGGDSAAIDEDMFGEHWSPRRRFPDEIEPLPRVVGTALERAGWWRRGSGSLCPGGVIVGADGGFIEPSVHFANHLRNGYSAHVSPNHFIHSLPSTTASLLTKLYGFTDYQTTFVHGAASGWLALGHALDLLSLGRIERAVVVTLSVTYASASDAVAKLGVAICLGPMASSRDYAITLDEDPGDARRTADDDLTHVLAPFGPVAALPLVKLARALEHEQPTWRTKTPDGVIVTVEH